MPINCLKTACFLTFIAAGLFNHGANAAADVFELSLQDLLNVRVITSTQQNETLKSAPSTLSVFTQEQIQAMGITRLAELMNFVPGFQSFRSDDNGLLWSYSSRGRRLGFSGNEILVMVDGVRLNDDWSGGNSHDFYISLENAKQVEFIRGPGSALYGSNAFLGVVNIVTEGASRAQVEVGTDDYKRLVAQWQGGAQDLNIEFAGEYIDSGGEEYTLYNPDPSVMDFVQTQDPFVHKSAQLKLGFKHLSFRARYSKNHLDGFYLKGGASTVPKSQRYTDSVNSYYELNIENPIGNQWGYEAALRYVDREVYFIGLLSESPMVVQEAELTEREWGASARFRYQGDQARAVIGAEFRRPSHPDISSTIAGTPVSVAMEGERKISGLYGQWQYSWQNDWEAIAGLRLDDYSDFGTHLSPRLGLIHHLNTENSLKLLLGEAFRAPTWSELYVQGAPVVIGNPDLQPEVVETVELVWVNMKEGSHTQVSLFNVYIDDAIVRDSETLSFSNKTKASTAGIELEYRKSLSPNWDVLALLTTIFDTANKFNTESKVFGGGSVAYRKNALTASLSVNYQGEKKDPQSVAINGNEFNRLDAREVLTFHAAYKVNDHLKVKLNIKNLLDNEYLNPAERDTNIVGVPGNRRRATLALNWVF